MSEAIPAAKRSRKSPGETLHSYRVRKWLGDGAFSVVDRPCHPETMLRIMQRIMDRHFTHSHSPHPSQEKQS